MAETLRDRLDYHTQAWICLPECTEDGHDRLCVIGLIEAMQIENARLRSERDALLEAARWMIKFVEGHEFTAGLLNTTPWLVATCPNAKEQLRAAVARCEEERP